MKVLGKRPDQTWQAAVWENAGSKRGGNSPGRGDPATAARVNNQEDSEKRQDRGVGGERASDRREACKNTSGVKQKIRGCSRAGRRRVTGSHHPRAEALKASHARLATVTPARDAGGCPGLAGRRARAPRSWLHPASAPTTHELFPGSAIAA